MSNTHASTRAHTKRAHLQTCAIMRNQMCSRPLVPGSVDVNMSCASRWGWCSVDFRGVLSGVSVGFGRVSAGVSVGFPRGFRGGFRGGPGVSGGFRKVSARNSKIRGFPPTQQNYAKRDTFRTFWPHDPLPPGGFHPQPNPNIIILKGLFATIFAVRFGSVRAH